jgi:hypothetical protein
MRTSAESRKLQRIIAAAADLSAEVGDHRREAALRTNLADCLYRLSRHGEARTEVRHAIDLNRPFGHAADPWAPWGILSAIENDLGNVEAGAVARQEAIAAYESYRRGGGEPRYSSGQLVIQVTSALSGGASAEELVSKLAAPAGAPPAVSAFFKRLCGLLTGSRDPALLADPALDYHGVVELTLLVERFAQSE